MYLRDSEKRIEVTSRLVSNKQTKKQNKKRVVCLHGKTSRHYKCKRHHPERLCRVIVSAQQGSPAYLLSVCKVQRVVGKGICNIKGKGLWGFSDRISR